MKISTVLDTDTNVILIEIPSEKKVLRMSLDLQNRNMSELIKEIDEANPLTMKALSFFSELIGVRIEVIKKEG